MDPTQESIRRLRQRAVRALFTGAMAALTLAIVVSGWQQFERMKWSADYSRLPAQSTYEWVMAQPAPAGLTGLRVSGRRYCGMKNWVWMRFDLSPTAMEKVLRGRERLTVEEARRRLGGYRSVETRFDPEDQRAVGWHDVNAIERPEIYSIGSEADHSSFIWFGTLTLDRKNRRGFIRAHGD